MGKVDDLSKEYMRDSNRFADLVNNVVFGGEPVINPQYLVEKDPTEIGIVPKNLRGFLSRQKVRDVLKGYEDVHRKLLILVIGIENQTDIHYAMPIKSNLYDALDYAAQVETLRKVRRGEKSYGSKAEFLTGMTKDDRLTPVITIVLYLGSEKWDGPRTLHEMLDTDDERILNYVPNYRINLFDPNEIEDFEGFTTELRWVLETVRAGSDKDSLLGLFARHENIFGNLDTETASMINVLLGEEINKKETEQGGSNNMLKAAVQLREEGHAQGLAQGLAQGRKEGRKEGRNETVYALVQDGDLPEEKGAARLGIDVSQLKANMLNMGYKWPSEE